MQRVIPLLLQGEKVAWLFQLYPQCEGYYRDFLTLLTWPDAIRVLDMPSHNPKWQAVMQALFIEFAQHQAKYEHERWELLMKKTLF